MEDKHTYKMYAIVLRQLDGINSGIQAAHGVCEYIWKHLGDEDLHQWLQEDKTLVVLNGGGSQEMEETKRLFLESGIKFETFEEEDLGNLTTCIALLADERVWDQETWPKFEKVRDALRAAGDTTPDTVLMSEWEKGVGGHCNSVKKRILNNMRTV